MNDWGRIFPFAISATGYNLLRLSRRSIRRFEEKMEKVKHLTEIFHQAKFQLEIGKMWSLQRNG